MIYFAQVKVLYAALLQGLVLLGFFWDLRFLYKISPKNFLPEYIESLKMVCLILVFHAF